MDWSEYLRTDSFINICALAGVIVFWITLLGYQQISFLKKDIKYLEEKIRNIEEKNTEMSLELIKLRYK